MPLSFEKRCEDLGILNVFDFTNTTDVTDLFKVNHKLFPGIPYKNIRDFDPDKIIREM